MANLTGKGSWKPGQSGNPNGRPKDPLRQEVIDIFKKAAPDLLKLAIKRAQEGSDRLLGELIKKALPDKLDLGGELSESLAAVARAILEKRAGK